MTNYLINVVLWTTPVIVVFSMIYVLGSVFISRILKDEVVQEYQLRIWWNRICIASLIVIIFLGLTNPTFTYKHNPHNRELHLKQQEYRSEVLRSYENKPEILNRTRQPKQTDAEREARFKELTDWRNHRSSTE